MLKQIPRGLVGGHISPEEAKLLQLPMKATNSIVGWYETLMAPKLVEFRIQDTVLTFRDYNHDRAQNYLFGVLRESIRKELVEGIDWSNVKYKNGRNWKDFIPEKLRVAWPLLDGVSQMAVCIAARRGVEVLTQNGS